MVVIVMNDQLLSTINNPACFTAETLTFSDENRRFTAET